MKYIYQLCHSNYDNTWIEYERLGYDHVTDGWYVKVFKEECPEMQVPVILNTPADLDEWRDKLARDAAWKPKDKWNPFEDTDIHPTASMYGFAKDKANDVLKNNIEKYLGKTPVNPKHYQAYMAKTSDGVIKDYPFEELQWLESEQYSGVYKDQTAFIPAILLQARKYIARLGGKDDEVQEIMKAIWYLKFMAAYIKNKGPIRVVDIEEILGDEV